MSAKVSTEQREFERDMERFVDMYEEKVSAIPSDKASPRPWRLGDELQFLIDLRDANGEYLFSISLYAQQRNGRYAAG